MTGDSDAPTTNRRRFLAGVGTAGALAGCLGRGGRGGDGTDDEEPDEQDIEEERRLNGEVLRSAFPMQLYEGDSDERVAEIHYHTEFSHWHFMPFEIPLDGYRPVEVRVYNADDEVIPLGPDEQFQLEITRTEGTPADLLELEITQGSLVNFHGESAGEGEILFHLVDGDETVWTTPPLTVRVGADDGSS